MAWPETAAAEADPSRFGAVEGLGHGTPAEAGVQFLRPTARQAVPGDSGQRLGGGTDMNRDSRKRQRTSGRNNQHMVIDTYIEHKKR